MDGLALDPALRLALRAGLGLVLLRAAWHKLRAPSAFRAALRDYRILPEIRLVLAPAAWGLALAESAAGLALLGRPEAAAPALAAVGLLGLYSFAIALNLARGRRELDCGCAGPAAPPQPIGEGLLVRNAVLIAVALGAGLPPSARALAWLDAVSITGGAAALLLLYAAVEVAMSNAPRLQRLRGPA